MCKDLPIAWCRQRAVRGSRHLHVRGQHQDPCTINQVQDLPLHRWPTGRSTQRLCNPGWRSHGRRLENWFMLGKICTFWLNACFRNLFKICHQQYLFPGKIDKSQEAFDESSLKGNLRTCCTWIFKIWSKNEHNWTISTFAPTKWEKES